MAENEKSERGGAGAAAEEKSKRGAKAPLIAGAAAAAAVAGWVVVAGRNARRTVLGVKVPGGKRSAGQVIGDGAREVGSKVGSLPGVRDARDRLRR